MSPIVSPVRIEIWSDVICPWCYIGKSRFDTALANVRARGIDAVLQVVYRAYQLDPTAPADRAEPAIDGYAKKFGGPDRARAIVDQVTRIAAGDGLVFDMDNALRANTRLAHRAIAWARLHGGTDAQSLLNERLMRAYFAEGCNIGDLDTVTRCAKECNLSDQELRQWLLNGNGNSEVDADLQGAAEHGITAVPSFVIDDQFIIPGAQDVQVFEQILEKLLTR